jgi:hypothetical protein
VHPDITTATTTIIPIRHTTAEGLMPEGMAAVMQEAGAEVTVEAVEAAAGIESLRRGLSGVSP